MSEQNKDEREQLRRWVETWERAGKALEEIRRKELREFDCQKNWQQIDAMLEWACQHAEPRTTSGLLEQQRWFMKFREKMMKAGETQ